MDAVFIGGKFITGEFARTYRRTFSTSYQTYHNVKIMYSGNDYRSWIDVIVSYDEIFKNESLLENKYHYQSISESQRISMIPNAKDQMLVFNIGKRLNKISFILKSCKEFTIINRSSIFNLELLWYVPLQAITDSVDRQIACQGKIFELKVNSECEANKTCPKLILYWIRDHLSKYKNDSQNKPHNCFIQNHLSMEDKMYYLNFSSNSRILNYIYITAPPAKVQDMLNNDFLNIKKKVSWNFASSMCQYMGGFLPIIRTKSELDEFIALILFSQYIPPQDEIFISLSTMISKL